MQTLRDTSGKGELKMDFHCKPGNNYCNNSSKPVE